MYYRSEQSEPSNQNISAYNKTDNVQQESTKLPKKDTSNLVNIMLLAKFVYIVIF